MTAKAPRKAAQKTNRHGKSAAKTTVGKAKPKTGAAQPVGRPSKYTPEMCDKIIACGKQGGSVSEMAVACEVAIQTLYDWKDIHSEFSEAFTCAQTYAEAFHAARVREGLEKTPAEFQGPANLKYMAQRFQERWSERHKVELSGPDGGPIPLKQVLDDLDTAFGGKK